MSGVAAYDTHVPAPVLVIASPESARGPADKGPLDEPLLASH